MKSILKNMQWITTCIGIEVNIGAGQELDYRLCTVAINGDQLSILSKEKVSGDQLPDKIKGRGPFALCITGRGLLVKKSRAIDSLHAESLNTIFPNLKAEEFYIQNFISGESSYLTVIRREIADEILRTLRDGGLDILQLSLGPFHVDHILPQLNCYGNEVVFDGHIVQLEDRFWSSYRFDAGASARFPLKLGIEPVEEGFILAYASAFQLLMHNRVLPVEITANFVTYNLAEYKEQRLFKFRSKALLVSLCLTMVVNFIVFSVYDSENQILASRLNSSTTSRGTVEQLEKAAYRKEGLLKSLGWNRGISYAYLCDQIGQMVPASAQLSRISINPERPGKSASQQDGIYETGKIHIEGLSSNLNEANNWIFQLKEKSWVKGVVLSSYSPTEEEGIDKLIVVISY